MTDHVGNSRSWCSDCAQGFQLRPEPPGNSASPKMVADDGLPVCLSCGGLAYTVNSKDFRERLKKIVRLKALFNPVAYYEKSNLTPDIAPVIRLRVICGLEREITALSRIYQPNPSSLAERISLFGFLDFAKGELIEARNTFIDGLRHGIRPDGTDVKDGLDREINKALIRAHYGQFDQARKRLQQLIRIYRAKDELSRICHQVGQIYFVFNRNYRMSSRWYRRALVFIPDYKNFWNLGLSYICQKIQLAGDQPDVTSRLNALAKFNLEQALVLEKQDDNVLGLLEVLGVRDLDKEDFKTQPDPDDRRTSLKPSMIN